MLGRRAWVAVVLALRVSRGAPEPAPPSLGGASGGASGCASGGAPAGERHPTYRVAVVLPWLGKNVPSYMQHTLSSCATSEYLFDFFVFHESHPKLARMRVPPNVQLVDLGQDGLARQVATALAAEEGLPPTEGAAVLRHMTAIFRKVPYMVVEYKPAYGVVFARWLQPYTHWAFSDTDVVYGDLPLFVTASELAEYDLVTYTYGDHWSLFLRGQLTLHRNAHAVNTVYRACEFVGPGLRSELVRKLEELGAIGAAAAAARRGGRKVRKQRKPAFNPTDEGCYSAAALSHRPHLRIKWRYTFWTDLNASGPFALVGGSLRHCPSDGGQGAGRRRGACELGPGADRDDSPAAAAELRHSAGLPGLFEPAGEWVPVARAPNTSCTAWVKQLEWRVCTGLGGAHLGGAMGEEVAYTDGVLRVRAAAWRTPDRRYDHAGMLHMHMGKRTRRIFASAPPRAPRAEPPAERAPPPRGPTLVVLDPASGRSPRGGPLLPRPRQEPRTEAEWRALVDDACASRFGGERVVPVACG